MNVAVYELPSLKLTLPPNVSISPIANPVTFSFAVKVIVNVASLVVELLATAFDPSVAVIVVGLLLSLNSLLKTGKQIEHSRMQYRIKQLRTAGK